MEKLIIMKKQLLFLHEELRKVKSFHKESSKNFKSFFTSMNVSFKILNKGSMFNDIHYMNIINLNIIESFSNQVLKQSHHHHQLHRNLKEEGNRLKVYEKEIDKRIKTLQSIYKRGEGLDEKNQFEEAEKEVESLLKDLSQNISLVRESIKKSFDTYIDGLCSFAETKKQMIDLHSRTEKSYRDCSPVIEKRFHLLLNFNKEEDHVQGEEQEIDYENENENENENEFYDKVYDNQYDDRIDQIDHPNNTTFYTPIKSNRRLFLSSTVSKNNYQVNNITPESKLNTNQSNQTKSDFKESRNKMVNSYLITKNSSSSNHPQNYPSGKFRRSISQSADNYQQI